MAPQHALSTPERPLANPVLGMIGGMSWTSTLSYYRLINQGVARQRGGLASAPLLLASLDFTVVADCQRCGDWLGAARLMGEAGAGLRRAGAGALLIATNTMHKVAQPVAEAAGLPLLHIVEATVQAAQRLGATHLGLLGTRFTMEDMFWQADLARFSRLRCSVPPAAVRAEVHRIIFDELCQDRLLPSSRQALVAAVQGLAEQGCDAVVLGCTELALLLDPGAPGWPVPLIDTTTEHAAAAVRWLCPTEEETSR